MEQSFHSLDWQQALRQLSSSEKGLNSEEAKKRLEQHGPNQLKEAPKKPLYVAFLEEFKESVVLLLIAAGVITFLIGEHLDSAAIFAIVVLNAIFGFIQEYRAEKAIDALKKMLAPLAKVVRDGAVQQIPARELVPGDVVVLEAGDQVPADCRLIEAQMLSLVEAPLTGESSSVSKSASITLAENTFLAERKNLVFAGTSAARGNGRAVVFATGMETEFGKIAGQVQQTQEEQTPLARKLEALGKKLSVVAVALVALIFVAGIARGLELFPMFLTAVSLAVAAVPEGLPAIVTITLAIGVQRMIHRNAIIRKLHAVETLGSADIICTDKTGTLTRNEMTVRSVFFDSREISVEGSGYEVKGGFFEAGGASGYEPAHYSPAPEFELFLRASSLCTTAELRRTENGVVAVGDGTEISLVVLAAKGGVDKVSQLSLFPKVAEIPFESERKMMSTVHANAAGSLVGGSGKFAVFCKGAPETLLENCTRAYWGGEFVQLTPAIRKSISLKTDQLASRGLRVLAIATRHLDSLDGSISPENIERELVFLGLVAMNDPPREQVKGAIALCKSAGIRVIMITGDNPLTASSIAQEIGISSNGSVLTGADLDSLNEAQLSDALGTVSVLARVSPAHKLRVVSALQRAGHIVAMTGDGVNDAPALKKADIGVAMGVTGTDVSKEASDMVLVDDNFASIVSAAEEGRTIFDNIGKSISYLLSCNSGELLTVFAATIFSWPLPLLPIQILWMNLVTDGLPALALGMEPAEPDVMTRPPRPPNQEILSLRNMAHLTLIGLFMAIVTLSVFYSYLAGGQGDFALNTPKAQTVAFCLITFLQFAQAFNSRSRRNSVLSIGVFKNKFLWLAVISGVVLQVAIVQTSAFGRVFGTVPLALGDWLAIGAASLSLLVAYEFWKLFKKAVPSLA